MDNLIKDLSDDQLKKLVKKDHKIIIELQKEIHNQKDTSYEKLKIFYWSISVALVVILFLLAARIENRYSSSLFLGAFSSFLIALIGGKIFFIYKPEVSRKAIAKSRVLDAMEIQSVSVADTRKKIFGLILLILAGLLYLITFITMLIIKH